MGSVPLNPSDGIAVFTDGSSYYKDRSGGWAWLAMDSHGSTVVRSGSATDTTNNQMELYAPTHALQWLYDNLGSVEVLVHSDSEYVVLGYNDRTRKRKVNTDFWRELDNSAARHDHVEFIHVKGHAGHEYNELVDKLAGKARKNGIF